MAVRISKEEFEEKVLKEKLPVIVDFYSDSCIACKRLAPALGEIEDEFEDKIKVVKVNTNFDLELAQEYDIISNPTILLVINGEVVDRKTGAQNPAQLKDWITPHLQ